MQFKRYFLSIALGLTASFFSFATYAGGSAGGQLNVQMTLTSSCAISGASGLGSTNVNFGSLNFGSQPSTFSGTIAADASGGAGGAGSTQVVCSPDVSSLTVSVSGGNNAGQGGAVGTGSRAMKLGANFLPYEVYSDSAMTTAYPAAATPLGVALPGNGAPLTLPVYGRVNKTSTNAMPAGSYADVLHVTVAW
jgi:spore coat protein U-like protein